MIDRVCRLGYRVLVNSLGRWDVNYASGVNVTPPVTPYVSCCVVTVFHATSTTSVTKSLYNGPYRQLTRDNSSLIVPGLRLIPSATRPNNANGRGGGLIYRTLEDAGLRLGN